MCSNLPHTSGPMSNFEEQTSVLWLKAIFPYSSCWIEVEPSQTFQVYLSSNLSYFTTDIHSERRNSDTGRITNRPWRSGNMKRARKMAGHEGEMTEKKQDKLKH